MTPTAPVDVVRGFYRALVEQDARAVEALVDEHFAEHASISWPESLPYGGTVSGRSRLRKVLAGAASGGASGPADLELVALTEGVTEVAAEVRFTWRATAGDMSVKSGAVEWWSFDERGKVVSIRAYYADTAALQR